MIKRYVSRLQDKSDALHCMILSTSTHAFLLPSVAIAEIYSQPNASTQNTCSWREISIPFTSMERLLAQADQERQFQHTAVLHRLNPVPASEPSFWAIGLTALPKVIRIEHGDVDLETEQPVPHCIAVRIAEESLLIPDLQMLESAL